MLLTITLILSTLVILNLLLLKYSCNKIKAVNKEDKKPVVLQTHKTTALEFDQELAPTGS